MEKVDLAMDDFLDSISEAVKKEIAMIKDFCSSGYAHKKIMNLRVNGLKIKLRRERKSNFITVRVIDKDGEKMQYKIAKWPKPY